MGNIIIKREKRANVLIYYTYYTTSDKALNLFNPVHWTLYIFNQSKQMNYFIAASVI